MSITQLQEGRRIFSKTLWGDYDITIKREYSGPIFDRDGNELGTVSLTIKEPPPPKPAVLTEEQTNRVSARLAICRDCDQYRGNGRVTVTCAKCTTCRNAKDLLREESTCPIGEW